VRLDRLPRMEPERVAIHPEPGLSVVVRTLCGMGAPSQWSLGQESLFAVPQSVQAGPLLDRRVWPSQQRFPVNHGGSRVGEVLWGDLVESSSPLVVAGFASIGELIELLAAWGAKQTGRRPARLLFGNEPFGSAAKSFADPKVSFTEEVRDYWLEHNVSVLMSAKLLRAIELVETKRVEVRCLTGQRPLHAKIYVGADAATLGSSNFTGNGLRLQAEANARFERRSDEGERFDDLRRVAENFWSAAEDWHAEFLEILRELLREVSWQEALARACAELLEGEWATRYVGAGSLETQTLWPSQRSGIAQALWIIENVGSVLVADATGSGKTRMGAHLVRAVRDRLWSTGRIRRDITVLVCPPAVLGTWRSEGLKAGAPMVPVSQGILSRGQGDDASIEQQSVRGAQLLAVDEAHNFLNSGSKRTMAIREHLADHVMLFTATPISRGAGDLLDLVALLGPDNFEDRTLEVLQRLDRPGGGASDVMSTEEAALVRREIARFVLRRTKSQINGLVDRSPDDYVHPQSGRVCRYPTHEPRVYETAETDADSAAADAIRSIGEELLGLALLPTRIVVPEWLKGQYDDAQWLHFRMASAAGLAQHQVLNSLRSSRAALVEHLLGTDAAVRRFSLPEFKATTTPGVLVKLRGRVEQGPPDVTALECELPEWATDPESWRRACMEEIARYEAIELAVSRISGAREEGKRRLLAELAERHERVLVFDHSLVTLTFMKELLSAEGIAAELATGQQSARRRARVTKAFAPDSTERAVALCSDAMNEGINLQGASVVVHLDLPTTLRVAEQRVGRVDRMDSRHDSIESWWPSDGRSFATRAHEKLAQRAQESETLLGANLSLPDLTRSADRDQIVTAESQIDEFNNAEPAAWDGIQDALSPIRSLVEGEAALIPPRIYDHYRQVSARVISYVSALESDHPWALFAVRATANGAPRWMLVEDGDEPRCEVDLANIVERLRELLAPDPPRRRLDEQAIEWLTDAVGVASAHEHRLLPRRMIRALDQAHHVTGRWMEDAQRAGAWELATRWAAIQAVTRPSMSAEQPDAYTVAERWLTAVAPILEERRMGQRRRARFTLLRDITGHLEEHPLSVDDIEDRLAGIPFAAPLEKRISACIVGVPAVSDAH